MKADGDGREGLVAAKQSRQMEETKTKREQEVRSPPGNHTESFPNVTNETDTCLSYVLGSRSRQPFSGRPVTSDRQGHREEKRRKRRKGDAGKQETSRGKGEKEKNTRRKSEECRTEKMVALVS